MKDEMAGDHVEISGIFRLLKLSSIGYIASGSYIQIREIGF
jgi:hypothetical protein